MTKEKKIKVAKAKGQPFLQWVGKKPLDYVTPFPAQLVETFNPANRDDKPSLLFHGDNKEVLVYLLASGYRGKVNLVYIDPPFNTGADNYVRKMKLRAQKGKQIEGERMSLIEQTQYANAFHPDLFMQFIFERLMLLSELLSENGVLILRMDYRYGHYIKVVADEVFGVDNFINEIAVSRQRESAGSPRKLEVSNESLLVYTKGHEYTLSKPVIDRPVANISWTAFLMGGERSPRERTFMGLELTPPSGQHFSLRQEKVDKLLAEKYLRLRCRGCRALHYESASQSSLERYMRKKANRFKFYDLTVNHVYFGTEQLVKCFSCESSDFAVDYLGSDKQTLSNDWTDIPSYSNSTGYPTENSPELLDRIISTFSNPGELVLDCFVGSGTTGAMAQTLNRRWIGCDINKGAIQTTGKRLQTIIREQLAEGDKPKQGELEIDDNQSEDMKPSSLCFDVFRVNEYDLQIQHNEAVKLACERIGITRIKTDAFFDGIFGKRLVKIVPLQHPCTLLHLEQVTKELKNRLQEDRDVMIVSLGKEVVVDKWIEDWNRVRKINKIELIELRTDKKYGGFIEHKPAQGELEIKRKGKKVQVKIKDFLSPTIVDRLNMEESAFKATVTDFRSMIDVVLIDTDYDGKVFNICHSDVPPKKNDLIEGAYSLDINSGKRVVAVKIIDMLGEEVLFTKKV